MVTNKMFISLLTLSFMLHVSLFLFLYCLKVPIISLYFSVPVWRWDFLFVYWGGGGRPLNMLSYFILTTSSQLSSVLCPPQSFLDRLTHPIIKPLFVPLIFLPSHHLILWFIIDFVLLKIIYFFLLYWSCLHSSNGQIYPLKYLLGVYST